ncbi:MAG: hypothetical protein IIC56_03285, partial [Proteobacteria bacterium]|nr:hypothetical protein [Pseudomonadota bacterium]
LSTFTFSFWINTTESGSNGTYHRNPTLFGMRQGGGNQDLGIYTENGYIGIWSSLSGGDDNYQSTTTQINDGQWHQITVSNDGANVSLYVDGAFEAVQVDHERAVAGGAFEIVFVFEGLGAVHGGSFSRAR